MSTHGLPGLARIEDVEASVRKRFGPDRADQLRMLHARVASAVAHELTDEEMQTLAEVFLAAITKEEAVHGKRTDVS